MPKQRLVIVGNGMAAARLLEELAVRGAAAAFQISVFGEEPSPSYDRLLLADVMNGGQSVAQVLHVGLNWYGERGIRAHLGERAVLVSRQARIVYGSAGTEERYDSMVFATGSSPHFPPIKQLFNAAGKRLPGVCDFRTLADCTQIMALANGARAVAIIGGGILGLEAARGLAGRARIELVHRGARLSRQGLDEVAALSLQRRLEGRGVHFHLNRGVDALLGDERVTGLLLNDGTEVACDLVVLATGLIPNTWLGYQCGLSVERGINVDQHMGSVDDRRIFALGECAQRWGGGYCDAAEVRQQARVLAERLLPTAIPGPVADARTWSPESLS